MEHDPAGVADGPAIVRLLDDLRRKCGLKRDELLERKIAGVLRQHPLADRLAWVDDLTSREPSDPQWLAFVEAVTVHETYFFRDPGQLDVLATAILPAVLEDRAARGRHLRVWSAGCASGEEAFTVAMLALEAIGARGEGPEDWRVEILGSDISRAVVAQAAQGIYGGPGLNAFRRLPDRYARHFEAVPGDLAGRRRVTAPLAAMVSFRQHNLMDAAPPGTGFDIALCRNVFIYFDGAAQARAVASLARAVVDGGHLLLGVTDRLAPGCGFRRLSPGTAVIYRRESAP